MMIEAVLIEAVMPVEASMANGSATVTTAEARSACPRASLGRLIVSTIASTPIAMNANFLVGSRTIIYTTPTAAPRARR